MIRPIGIIVCLVTRVILSVVVSYYGQRVGKTEKNNNKKNSKVTMILARTYLVSVAFG